MQFEVAIWKRWPSYGFPITANEVEASSAFAAVEQVMRAHRLRQAGHVAALAGDGSIQYRAYRVWLVPTECPAQRQSLWSVTLAELLFAWGQVHGFPELRWPFPESAEVWGITLAGEESWIQACQHGVPEYIQAAYWAAMRQGRT